MKNITLSLITMFLLILPAYGEDNSITQVKNIPINNVKVGDIFANWKNCENGEWN